jgi:hypothetical protein
LGAEAKNAELDPGGVDEDEVGIILVEIVHPPVATLDVGSPDISLFNRELGRKLVGLFRNRFVRRRIDFLAIAGEERSRDRAGYEGNEKNSAGFHRPASR